MPFEYSKYKNIRAKLQLSEQRTRELTELVEKQEADLTTAKKMLSLIRTDAQAVIEQLHEQSNGLAMALGHAHKRIHELQFGRMTSELNSVMEENRQAKREAKPEANESPAERVDIMGFALGADGMPIDMPAPDEVLTRIKDILGKLGALRAKKAEELRREQQSKEDRTRATAERMADVARKRQDDLAAAGGGGDQQQWPGDGKGEQRRNEPTGHLSDEPEAESHTPLTERAGSV